MELLVKGIIFSDWYLIIFLFARNLPVIDFGFDCISFVVPVATISPPFFPASGPKSII